MKHFFKAAAALAGLGAGRTVSAGKNEQEQVNKSMQAFSFAACAERGPANGGSPFLFAPEEQNHVKL